MPLQKLGPRNGLVRLLIFFAIIFVFSSRPPPEDDI